MGKRNINIALHLRKLCNFLYLIAKLKIEIIQLILYDFLGKWLQTQYLTVKTQCVKFICPTKT